MKFDLLILDDIFKDVNAKYNADIKESGTEVGQISDIQLLTSNIVDNTVVIWLASNIPGKNIMITYDLEDGKTEKEYRQDITQLIFDKLDKEFEDVKSLTQLTDILEDMAEKVKISYKNKEPRLTIELIYTGEKRLTEVYDTIIMTGGVTGRVKNKLKSNDILPQVGKKFGTF